MNRMRSVYSILTTGLKIDTKNRHTFFVNCCFFSAALSQSCTIPKVKRFSVKSQHEPFYLYGYNCYYYIQSSMSGDMEQKEIKLKGENS